MMDHERTEKNLQEIFQLGQQAYQAAVENACALQEKTLEFAQSLLKASAEDLRTQAENNHAIFESLVEQSRRQREAMEELVRQSAKAYESLLQNPLSHHQQHPEFEKATEAPEVSPER